MAFGENVKRLRILRGMSQTELAEKIGYKTPSMIAHIENDGKSPAAALIPKFAKVLNCSIAQLLEETKEEKKVSEIYRICGYLMKCDDKTIEIVKKIIGYRDPRKQN